MVPFHQPEEILRPCEELLSRGLAPLTSQDPSGQPPAQQQQQQQQQQPHPHPSQTPPGTPPGPPGAPRAPRDPPGTPPGPPEPPSDGRHGRRRARASQRTDCAVGSGEWAEPPHSPWTLLPGGQKRAIFRPFLRPSATLLHRPSQATGEPGGRGLWRTAYRSSGGDPGPWMGPGRPLTGPIAYRLRAAHRVDGDTLSERDEPSEVSL
jgi:hypothetical protein